MAGTSTDQHCDVAGVGRLVGRSILEAEGPLFLYGAGNSGESDQYFVVVRRKSDGDAPLDPPPLPLTVTRSINDASSCSSDPDPPGVLVVGFSEE